MKQYRNPNTEYCLKIYFTVDKQQEEILTICVKVTEIRIQ